MTTMETPTPPSQGHSTMLLGIIAAVLVLGVLREASFVILPVVVAIFLAMLVQPPLLFFERFFSRAFSLLLVMLMLLAIFAGGWAFIVVSVTAVAERGPLYVERFLVLADRAIAPLERFGLPASVAEVPLTQVAEWTLSFVGASLRPVLATIGGATLATFTLVLMLLEIDSFRTKLRRGLRDEQSVEFVATLHSVTRQFQTYFFVKTLISLLTGVLSGLVAWGFGVDFPFIWGTLTVLLNFIPNIGSMIAVVPPVLLALVQFDGLARPVTLLAALTAIQVTIGNFLDPRWLGRSLSLSPLVVFVMMVFWGWVWGIVGIFLAVPLTILMKIAFEQIVPLRPIAVLMGGIPRKQTRTAPPIDDEEVTAALATTGKFTTEQ